MADKITGLSADVAQANFAALARLFPSCVVEQQIEGAGDADGKTAPVQHTIDIAKLLALIGRDAHSVTGVPDTQAQYEPFGFLWAGKRQALTDAQQSIDKTMRPVVDESVDFAHTRNLYIEGDNLDGLKLLMRGYSGAVKMIYLDPPYNTGADFVYKDSFVQSQADYDREAGILALGC